MDGWVRSSRRGGDDGGLRVNQRDILDIEGRGNVGKRQLEKSFKMKMEENDHELPVGSRGSVTP